MASVGGPVENRDGVYEVAPAVDLAVKKRLTPVTKRYSRTPHAHASTAAASYGGGAACWFGFCWRDDDAPPAASRVAFNP